jgi:hypothetical protein
MVNEEDIPAYFPEENDDLLVKEPVCKCRLLFYTLEQKKKICRWTVQMQEDTVLPADPYLHIVKERTIIKDHKN